MSKVKKFSCLAESSDRLDHYIAQKLVEEVHLSRALAKKLIIQGKITVDGEIVEPNFRLKRGNQINLEIPSEEPVRVEAQEIPLKIVFEDGDCLVIDKESGMVVHPAVGHEKGTIVNALLSHFGQKESDEVRAGIVHRLDKNTSGLMVIAKNNRAEENLRKQFKEKQVKKIYLCLVEREVKPKVGVINKPISRHPKNRQKFAIVPEGKEAITQFKVIKEYALFSLVEAQPLTGRTHQIRVHFSSIGHPIVGDNTYGGKRFLKRQFLHSHILGFRHPGSEKWLEFKSELPEDLENFIFACRKPRFLKAGMKA